ncbi:MAG: FAD-dependent oxidoreductase [Polyangiaceae bacterium]
MILSSGLARVAAGGSPSLAALPIRACLDDVELIQAEVDHIDTASHTLTIDGSVVRSGVAQPTLVYDHLIVALGTRPSYRDVVGAESRALPMSTLQDALRLRTRMLDSLAAADAEDSPRRRRSLLTTVVVGAGAHGCQLAGELLGFFRRCLPMFPRVRAEDLQVILVEREPACLPKLDATLGERARATLVRDGVQLRLGADLIKVEDDHVILHDHAAEKADSVRVNQRVNLRTLTPIAPPVGGADERVDARIVVWTPRGGIPGITLELGTAETRGKIPVEATLRSPAHEGVWVVGDLAEVEGIDDRTDDKAIRQAKLAAANVLNSLRKQPLRKASKPLIKVAALGPQHGVGTVLGLPLGGLAGSWVWSSLWALRLPGWRWIARAALGRVLEAALPSSSAGALRLAEAPIPLFLTPMPAAVKPIIPAIPRLQNPPPQPVAAAALSQATQPSPGTTPAAPLPPVSTVPMTTVPLAQATEVAPKPPPPPPPSRSGASAATSMPASVTPSQTVPGYPATVPPTVEVSSKTERISLP